MHTGAAGGHGEIRHGHVGRSINQRQNAASAQYYTIPGVFQFHGQPAPPAQVGEVPYEAVFVPSDTDNYNLVYFTVRIRVLKAFATITLSNLEHTYSGEACCPSYATNIVKRTEGGNEYYVNLDLPENEFTEFDRYLCRKLHL